MRRITNQSNDNMTEKANVIGLIAGQGRLPFIVADGARKAGLRVICVGLAGNAEPEIAQHVDKFYNVPLARPGNWIKKLKNSGVTETIMVGRVAKSQIFTPWRILRYLPDWHALKIWYWTLRSNNKQNQTILAALADELADGGIILDDSTKYCKEHLASRGVMTKNKPSKGVENDVEFGWKIAKKVAELDIGQAIAIKERDIIAIEAIEGTAEMIKRAGTLCKKGGWTLVKVAKHNQDMRFDVPCIGADTIKALAENGCISLVVEADKVIIIDKPQTIELAEKYGITIIGC
jgi:UDP-2,3-diacylglucosamine hydrolase